MARPRSNDLQATEQIGGMLEDKLQMKVVKYLYYVASQFFLVLIPLVLLEKCLDSVFFNLCKSFSFLWSVPLLFCNTPQKRFLHSFFLTSCFLRGEGLYIGGKNDSTANKNMTGAKYTQKLLGVEKVKGLQMCFSCFTFSRHAIFSLLSLSHIFKH